MPPVRRDKCVQLHEPLTTRVSVQDFCIAATWVRSVGAAARIPDATVEKSKGARNSFILFKSAQQHFYNELYAVTGQRPLFEQFVPGFDEAPNPQAGMSMVAAQAWNALSEEDKEPFFVLSKLEKSKLASKNTQPMLTEDVARSPAVTPSPSDPLSPSLQNSRSGITESMLDSDKSSHLTGLIDSNEATAVLSAVLVDSGAGSQPPLCPSTSPSTPSSSSSFLNQSELSSAAESPDLLQLYFEGLLSFQMAPDKTHDQNAPPSLPATGVSSSLQNKDPMPSDVLLDLAPRQFSSEPPTAYSPLSYPTTFDDFMSLPMTPDETHGQSTAPSPSVFGNFPDRSAPQHPTLDVALPDSLSFSSEEEFMAFFFPRVHESSAGQDETGAPPVPPTLEM